MSLNALIERHLHFFFFLLINYSLSGAAGGPVGSNEWWAFVYVCVFLFVCAHVLCGGWRGEGSAEADLTPRTPPPPPPQRLFLSLSLASYGPIAVALVTVAGSRQEKRLANGKCQLLLRICRAEWETAAARGGEGEKRGSRGRVGRIPNKKKI